MSQDDRTAFERPECNFKQKCYRKNPHHFKEFKHSHLATLHSKYPDSEVQEDTGIGLTNLKDQLRVYVDIENHFKRTAAAQTVQNNASPTPIRQNDSGTTGTYTNTDSANVVNQNGNAQKKRSRSPSAESTNHKKARDDTCKNERKESTEGKRKSRIELKLEAAAPFNYFLTKVKDNPCTHKDESSIYMTDLMHPSLGKIKSSLQVNFMVELEWLQMNYEVTRNDKQPLVILYGAENPELTSSDLPSNIRAVRVKPKYPYGTHHTKMMVFVYEDESVRVVVHTANLVGSDWENRTQGVWVSPRCPRLNSTAAGSTEGESPTGFRSSLIKYLRFYEVSAVKQFIDAIAAADMSTINVCFVASVPNSHKDGDVYRWGHRAVSRLLRQHASGSCTKWPVTVQCSSIGSLGVSPSVWFEQELGKSLSSHPGPSGALPSPGRMQLVYPSHEDVMASYDGALGGGCLPYSKSTNTKQPWLWDHMYRWKAEASSRTRAMPHIKTYTRVSPDQDKMAYFLLTSANLSKAAWGSMNKAGNSCLIMSYEAGVLFLPKFITGQDELKVSTFAAREGGSSHFPLHYDLPVTKYEAKQKPWLYDFLLS